MRINKIISGTMSILLACCMLAGGCCMLSAPRDSDSSVAAISNDDLLKEKSYTEESFGGGKCAVPISVSSDSFSALTNQNRTPDNNSYSQVIASSDEWEYSTPGRSALHGISLADYNANNYTGYKYTLGLYVGGNSFNLSENDNKSVGLNIISPSEEYGDFQFYFYSLFKDSAHKKVIEWGEYTPTGLTKNMSFPGGLLCDTLFITLTGENLYFTYFGENDNASDKGEYSDSFNNVVYQSSKGEELYELFSMVAEGEYDESLQVYIPYSPIYTDTACRVVESLEYYKTVNLPIPEKEGYTFTGWYYDEACTQKYNGEVITEDTELYAGFEINIYTVRYEAGLFSLDPNTAGLLDRTDSVEHGSVADYVPVYEYAEFIGWYYEDGTAYAATPITCDTTLYGQWRLDEYMVTLDLNGGECEGESVLTVAHGGTPVLPLVTRTGYEFVGWIDVTNDSENGEDYEPCAVVSNMVLRAKWKRNVYIVTFYVDGEIFKQVNVEHGKTLYEVVYENEVESANVVSYENLNYSTPAVAFNEFVVADDIAVYLSGVEQNVDINEGDVKGFFVKVKDFFSDYWITITVCGVAVIVMSFVLFIIFKRER